MDGYFLEWMVRDRLRGLRAIAGQEALRAASRPGPARWRRALSRILVTVGERVGDPTWRETWTGSRSRW